MTTDTIISATEAAAINDVRMLLKRIEERLTRVGMDDNSPTNAVALSAGMSAQQASVTEDAMFQTLNMLASHFDDSNADAAIKAYYTMREDERRVATS